MGVVVGFEVGEDLGVGIGAGAEGAVLEHLGLAGADEGLGPGVVIGIGARGHALAQAGLAQEFPESGAAVLAAQVAVEDEAGPDAARSQGLLEGRDDQVGAQMVGEGSADDFARAEVDDHGQIEPAGGGGDEGDVPGPDLVGLGRQGLAEEQVRGGLVGAAVAGFGHGGFGLDGSQAALAHDPADAIGGADFARIGEFRADAPVAMAAAMALEDGCDEVADPAVLGLGGRGRGGVVEAAARDLEGGADWPEAVAGGLVDVVDRVAELAGSLGPRMTAAFFKCHSPGAGGCFRGAGCAARRPRF